MWTNSMQWCYCEWKTDMCNVDMGNFVRSTCEHSHCILTFDLWAVTWQNKQSVCVPSEDSDQPRHPPSLIRVFAVHWPKVSSCRQQRFWSDWADAQADLSLRWVHSHFVDFVISCLLYNVKTALRLLWSSFTMVFPAIILTSIFYLSKRKL